MNYSWELLRANTRSERRRYPGKGRTGLHELYAERATRVTVVIESGIGVSTEFHGTDEPCLEHLIDRAVANTEHNPVRLALRRPDCEVTEVMTPRVSNVPRSTDLRGMPWLHDSGSERTRVDYSIEDSSGETVNAHFVQAWSDLGFKGHILARAPMSALSTDDKQPVWTPERLLFSPWVLSQILLEPLLSGILGTAPLRKWPTENLIDPGWGEGVDYDGTVRTLTVFTEGRTLRSAPLDRLHAWSSGREPTGHAGLTGPIVRDLVVLPEESTAQTLPSGTLVAEATCLAPSANGSSTVLALRLLNRNDTVLPPAIIELDDVVDLLDVGHWCGPWQRGMGPWTSRWLVIGVPSPWLRTHPV